MGFEHGVEIVVVQQALGLDAVQVAGRGGFLDHDVGAAAHWGAVEHGVRQDTVNAVGFAPAEGEDGPEVGSQLGEGFVVEFDGGAPVFRATTHDERVDAFIQARVRAGGKQAGFHESGLDDGPGGGNVIAPIEVGDPFGDLVNIVADADGERRGAV